MTTARRYLVEVRDSRGRLSPKKEERARKRHPFLFSKERYSIDDLCRYASFGQGRNLSIGPLELPAWMDGQGISYRPITW